MIDTPTLRARLDARITQAERLKIVRHTAEDTGCAHVWQTYRQTVIPESTRFAATGAYFIVRGCALRKGKRVIDYVVEQ